MSTFSKDLTDIRKGLEAKAVAPHLEEHIELPKSIKQQLFKDDNYFETPGYSATLLKTYLRNPSLVKTGSFMKKEEEKQTKSKKLGTILHRILLEDRNLKEFIPLLTPKEKEMFPVIIKNFLKNETIMNIMKNAEAQEFVINWKETERDAPCKAKLDLWTKDGFLFEMKTCSALEEIPRQIDKFRYDLQLSFYKRGIEQALNKEVEGAGIIAMETAPPYESHIYQLDESYLERGENGGIINRMGVLGWRNAIEYLVFDEKGLKRFERPVTVLSLS